MRFGLIIESNDPETAWNGVRFGVASLRKGHEVRIFLMSKGVESPGIEYENYNVRNMVEEFLAGGGEMHACGTCVKSRNAEDAAVCPISTMNDCIDMVEWADRTLTF